MIVGRESMLADGSSAEVDGSGGAGGDVEEGRGRAVLADALILSPNSTAFDDA